jgi:glycosyltransferase involved in cell wall biosynthesis
MKKIVHITSVHQRFDTRIFQKECQSLRKAGYDVSLVVADGKGNETCEGIKIYDIGKENNRIKRLLFTSKKVIAKAKELNADLYHYHDPDLLIAARSLSMNAHLVFDSHEDFPALMLQRDYIPNALRKTLFSIAKRIEKKSAKEMSAVVCATDNIRNKFLGYERVNAITIKNYPISNISQEKIDHCQITPPKACYVGGLTPIRGVKEMIIACEKAGVGLILAGPFDSEEYFKEMQQLSGWKNVEYLGYVESKEVKEKVYDKSCLGLVLLHKAPNHTLSIPIKQLEYMASGLPSISSKEVVFCKEVVEKENCGIVVDPLNTDEIADAIKRIIENKNLSNQMSENAFKAANDKYSWKGEEKNLLNLYFDLLKA